MRTKAGGRNHLLAPDDLVVAVSGDGAFLHVSVVEDLLRHMHGDHGSSGGEPRSTLDPQPAPHAGAEGPAWPDGAEGLRRPDDAESSRQPAESGSPPQPADAQTYPRPADPESVRGPANPSVAQARLVDFFDSSGTPAHPVVDPGLTVVGLRTVGRADPEAVLARITMALDLAQQRLDADPDLGRQQSLPPATDVPRPEGSLAEVLDELDRHFEVRGGAGHRAGWFHNLFHV